MKKNGFTLVEVLAVIVILAVLITVAVPSVMSLSTRIRTNMYCEKVKDIESASQLWGEDNFDSIDSGSVTVLDLKTNANVTYDHAKIVTVRTLLQKGHLKKDNNEPEDGDSFIIDPRDDSSLMNEKVLVFIKSGRVYANYQYTNIEDLNACSK